MPVCVVCECEKTAEELFCCEKCGAPEEFELPVLTYCAEHQEKHTMGYHKTYATPFTVYTKVLDILTTEEDSDKRQNMFVEDLLARWVGVEIPPRARPGSGSDPLPTVWSSPRMADLLLQTSNSSNSNGNPSPQYPSLVAFIGGTGSGKSTLIKSLIRLDGRNDATFGSAIEPIPSSQTTTAALSSTSSDIHLYLDPLTEGDEEPLLLADSEGLDGGDPISLRALDGEDMRQGDGENVAAIPRKYKLGNIEWAAGHKRDRSYIVGHLYPRFLYTFSNVICFVTKNSREITKEATSLLRWASTGYERTLNQRTPPALIIVMNQPRHVPDNSEWKDPDAAIDLWFKELDRNQEVHEFVELRKELSQKGMDISKPSEILKRYYSNIKLVWIPHNTATGKELHRPHAEIYSQLRRLHDEIRSAAETNHKLKATANLLLSTATFQVYTKKALSHFASKELATFDLEAAAGLVRPAPVIFREHVIAVLLLLQEGTRIQEEKRLFRKVADLIAAAVGFLAYQRNENDKIKHYNDSEIADQCKILYNTFLEDHWYCENVHYEKRCTNTKKGHSKGHQYEVRPDEIYGIRFRDGEFEANGAHLKCYEYFTEHILAKIRKLPQHYTPAAHMYSLHELRPWLGKLKTQRTCLSCLWRTPQHVLPCKHILCHECAVQFDLNDRKDLAQVWIASCPFGCPSAEYSLNWPWKTFIKPPSAGVRVLTLDGGGVRGIFEIMVLECLEGIIHNLGLKIPVIEMFDLVVGTSTGGVVALGLAHRRWTTEECREKFTDLAKKTFDLRPGMKVPGIRGVLKYAYSYIYRTEGVENAYKVTFGDGDDLFGSPTPTRVKVAVTAVERKRDGFRTYLLANYSRPFSLKWRDRLLRADSSGQELKTWEAARATSAAPLFFKPFTHPHTSQILEDGALRYDNPISIADQERYALWGDHCPLDLHLSLGTGFFPEPNNSPWRPPTIHTGLGVMAGIAREFVRYGMNAQKQYQTFVSSIHSREHAERYRRLNVDIDDGKGKTPIDKTDDEEFERLRKLASSYCLQAATRKEMERIARCLVASCFFFGDERWDAATERGGVWVCRGTLGSRLPLDRWEELKGFLDRGLKFVVRMEDSTEMTEKEISVGSSGDSLTQGYFRMDVCFEVVGKEMKDRKVVIELLMENWEGQWPISGFPRVIVGSKE